jgi:hypothetical protein
MMAADFKTFEVLNHVWLSNHHMEVISILETIQADGQTWPPHYAFEEHIKSRTIKNDSLTLKSNLVL